MEVMWGANMNDVWSLGDEHRLVVGIALACIGGGCGGEPAWIGIGHGGQHHVGVACYCGEVLRRDGTAPDDGSGDGLLVCHVLQAESEFQVGDGPVVGDLMAFLQRDGGDVHLDHV